MTASIVLALKYGIGRHAPSGVHGPEAFRSYPSGHTATAVILWGLLYAVVAEHQDQAVSRQVAWLLSWLAPLLVMVGMVLRDYHWVTDLVGAAALCTVLLQAERLALRHWRGARRGPESAARGSRRLLLLSAPHPARLTRPGRSARSGTSGSTSPAGWPHRPTGSGRSTTAARRLQVFELDRSCRVLRTIDAGIDPYDVEDLARARDGTFWLADIGDNGLNRSTVALERLRPDGSATLFRLTYPDGPHDAETVLLTPSGQLFIATKEPLASNVYTPAGPLSAARPTRAAQGRRRPGSCRPGPRAGRPARPGRWWSPAGRSRRTGGRWCCGRTPTRTSGRRPDGDVAAAISSGQRRRIPLPPTAQGEAVTFTPDGRSLLTSTEGVPAPVHVIPLGDAVPTPTPRRGRTHRRAAGRSPTPRPGDLLRTLAAPLVAVVAIGAALSFVLTRRR